jgi:predicted acetyltransferase
MKLIEPDITYKKQYLEMMDDWRSSNEQLVPFCLKYDTADFEEFIKITNSFKKVQDKGFVHHSTFWLITDDDQIAGVSNLRHYLNENLLLEGGHIGFGIRPSYRRKGYASLLLELTLLEAKKLNIDKALLTCDKSNIASAKTILKNGGALWKEHIHKGVVKQNYWIEIK